MASNKGKTHGKMGCWELTALFLQTQITHTSFRPRIRLEPSHTFHQLHCIKQLEGLEDSMSTTDLSSQFLIRTLMEISLYSLVIGTRPTTRYHQLVPLHFSHALCFLANLPPNVSFLIFAGIKGDFGFWKISCFSRWSSYQWPGSYYRKR